MRSSQFFPFLIGWLFHSVLVACNSDAIDHITRFDTLHGKETSNVQLARRQSADDSPIIELVEENSYYVATVKIGSSQEESKVVLDTGSADLWLIASNARCNLDSSSKRDLFDVRVSMRSMYMRDDHGSDDDNDNDDNDDIDNDDNDDNDDDDGRRTVATSTGTRLNTATYTTTSRSAGFCTEYGSFTTGNSDTYQTNNTEFDIVSYDDEIDGEGRWASDSVKIGNISFSDFTLGVVRDTTSRYGYLGIGFIESEASMSDDEDNSSDDTRSYPNFPFRLKQEGYIEKVVYSSYLNANTSQGSILFGAIDHAKFSGNLQTVPIVDYYPRDGDLPKRMDVVLSSLTFDDSENNITVYSNPAVAMLATGFARSQFPRGVISGIKDIFGLESVNAGPEQIDCKYKDSSYKMRFSFSGIQLEVPLFEFITTQDSNCFLVLDPHNSDDDDPDCFVLGTDFFKHAYVVFDLEDYEISLAPIVYTSDQDIEVVSSLVPGAVKADAYSSTSYYTQISTVTPVTQTSGSMSGRSTQTSQTPSLDSSSPSPSDNTSVSGTPSSSAVDSVSEDSTTSDTPSSESQSSKSSEVEKIMVALAVAVFAFQCA